VATEPNLRHLFAESSPGGEIDVAAVVRRARARRLPRMLGAGAVGTLAIAGLVVGGLQLGLSTAPASDAGASAPEMSQLDAAGGEEGASTMTKRAAAEQLNQCGAPVAAVEPSATGLVLETHFADVPSGAASIDGTVTMTNTGSAPVSGYTAAAPTLVLVRDGIVVWHSDGPTIELAREVSLAPGESLEYTVTLAPDDCGTGGVAPSGEYELLAVIDLMGDFDAELVSGPASKLTVK
jgi:hypothetical protein